MANNEKYLELVDIGKLSECLFFALDAINKAHEDARPHNTKGSTYAAINRAKKSIKEFLDEYKIKHNNSVEDK